MSKYFSIRILKAVNNMQACERYASHHRKMLKNYEIGPIESCANDWMLSDQSYLILAQDCDSLELYGGGRIQVKTPETYLPVERAVRDYSGHFVSHVAGEEERVAELCGVWFNKRAAGYGLKSICLIRFAIAIAHQLKIDALLGFCSPYTLPLIASTGGRIVTSAGDGGKFLYPTDEITSTLLVYEDLARLPYAEEQERASILNLRNNAYRPTKTVGPEGEGILCYDISWNSSDRLTYSS